MMVERGAGGRRYLSDLRMWRWHLLVFVVAGAALFVVRLKWADSLGREWFFWVILAWAALIVAHYLVAKTLTVDEGWADERAADLRMRSYDLKHVSQIVESAVDGDPATDPAAPRVDPPRPGGG